MYSLFYAAELSVGILRPRGTRGYSASISRIFACKSFLSGKQSLYSATIVGDKALLYAKLQIERPFFLRFSTT